MESSNSLHSVTGDCLRHISPILKFATFCHRWLSETHQSNPQIRYILSPVTVWATSVQSKPNSPSLYTPLQPLTLITLSFKRHPLGTLYNFLIPYFHKNKSGRLSQTYSVYNSAYNRISFFRISTFRDHPFYYIFFWSFVNGSDESGRGLVAPAVVQIIFSSAKLLFSVSEVDYFRASLQTLLQLFCILCAYKKCLCFTKSNILCFLCFMASFCIFISDI